MGNISQHMYQTAILEEMHKPEGVDHDLSAFINRN